MIDYPIRRSDRARRARINVSADGVEVAHPAGAPAPLGAPTPTEEPFRMPIYEVFPRPGQRSVGARPDEEHVAPGVHAHPHGRPRAHQMRQRIEPVVRQRFSARLELRGVVRVAPATDLDDHIMNAPRSGVGHEVVDRALRRDLVADDPDRFIQSERLSRRRCSRGGTRSGSCTRRQRASAGRRSPRDPREPRVWRSRSCPL